MRLAALALFLAFALIAAAPFNAFDQARIDERPGARVPLAANVVDEAGRPTTLAALAGGRPILLVPVLHDCPNLCEVTLDGLARAMRQDRLAGGRDVALIAFGIDPRETPADARGALGRLAQRHPELAGRMHATIATPAAIGAVTGALGYHFAYDRAAGQYAHAAAVAVLAPDGRLARWLYGLAPDPAALAAALADARAGRTSWAQQLLLLCYHYDPATGRYSLAIDWLLRGLGLLTAGGLLLFILLSRRREGARPC